MVLVPEDIQGKAGIQLRVVPSAARERTVLVVLDEVVVGVAGEGQGVEPQGIDGWELQQSEIGLGCGEVLQIEGDQVMAQQEVGTLGEVV